MSTNWPDLLAIRTKRKELGITQQQLGKLASVPQSIISRIEEGRISDPSYNTVKRVFEALSHSEQSRFDNRTEKNVPVAADLMNRQVISVKPSDQIVKAWNIMKKSNFSQLPVIDDRGRVAGGIKESSFLPFEGLEDDMEARTVQEIMGDPFPIVGMDTKSKTVVSILKSEQAVLVVEKGKTIGIITAYDLMENIYNKKPERVK
jgi:predicted transcriptional regulator